jgi:hypothetical protein
LRAKAAISAERAHHRFIEEYQGISSTASSETTKILDIIKIED